MKICIDAGHRNNANDYGASGNGYKESALALQIAHKVKTEFENKGHSVVLTRTTENDLMGIDARPRKAKQNGCNAFISIHLNAAGTPQAEGVEVLYKTQKHTATIMSARLSAATGFRNRGAKERTDLGVLNGFNNAVLVECGFISNPREAKLLADKTFQEKIAKTIVDSFLEAQGITPTDNKLSTEVAKKFGFNNATMQYLNQYKFANETFQAFLEGRMVGDSTKQYIMAYKYGQAILDKVYGGK